MLFYSSTEIKYSLPEVENVKIQIYNQLGQQVAVLVNGFQQAGVAHYHGRLEHEGTERNPLRVRYSLQRRLTVRDNRGVHNSSPDDTPRRSPLFYITR